MKIIPPLSTTGIGSVPFLDVDATIDLIAKTCPNIPGWPQFVRLSPQEDMLVQASAGLPLLRYDETRGGIVFEPADKEASLTTFYEHFLNSDFDWFQVPSEASSGFTALLERARRDPAFGPDFLKAQISGPITFGQSIRTPEDRVLVDDPELMDTVVKGLGAKAAWLAGQIRSVGRVPIVFLDEPGLTGFGSAFSTLKRSDVIDYLNEAADIARSEGEALIGTHVCGNTDWSMLAESDLDIINFDAFDYLDHLLLYPRQIGAFLKRGGYIAWGVVPTVRFSGQETANRLAEKLRLGWETLSRQGVDLDLIRRQTIISPACGTGTLSETTAREIYEMLPKVSAELA